MQKRKENDYKHFKYSIFTYIACIYSNITIMQISKKVITRALQRVTASGNLRPTVELLAKVASA